MEVEGRDLPGGPHRATRRRASIPAAPCSVRSCACCSRGAAEVEGVLRVGQHAEGAGTTDLASVAVTELAQRRRHGVEGVVQGAGVGGVQQTGEVGGAVQAVLEPHPSLLRRRSVPLGRQVGLEPEDRGVDGSVDASDGELPGERRQRGVHRVRGRRLQGDGALGDPAGLPRGQRAAHDLGPAARETVAQLDGLSDVRPTGVLAQAEGGGELGDGVLLDHERTLARRAQHTFDAVLGHRLLDEGVAANEGVADVRVRGSEEALRDVGATDAVQVGPVRDAAQLARRRQVLGPALPHDPAQRVRSVQPEDLDVLARPRHRRRPRRHPGGRDLGRRHASNLGVAHRQFRAPDQASPQISSEHFSARPDVRGPPRGLLHHRSRRI